LCSSLPLLRLMPVGDLASTVESASAAYFDITVAPHEYFDQTGFGPHSFRRWHVTVLQQVGATAIEAQRSAGHSSLNMTLLYSLEDQERQRQHIAKLWERITTMP
jgi:integrase